MQKSHLIPPQLPLVFIKAAGLSPPDDNANIGCFFSFSKSERAAFTIELDTIPDIVTSMHPDQKLLLKISRLATLARNDKAGY